MTLLHFRHIAAIAGTLALAIAALAILFTM
jgi:hypothetical protein